MELVLEANVRIEEKGELTYLHLSGLFSSAGERDQANELKNTIYELINNDRRKILLNFADVQLFSSSAIGAITISHSYAIDNKARLIIYNLPDFIRRGFEIIGLDKLFPLYGPEQSAVEFLNKYVK